MGKRIVKGLKYIINSVLSLIYDDGDQCKACDEVYDGELILCKQCYNAINFCDGCFYIKKEDYKLKIVSSAYYNNVIKKLITKFKYKNSFSSGEILSELMVKAYLKENINVDFITFVPIKESSFLKRGFNQSEFLAKEIGKALNIEVITTLSIHKKLLEQKRLGSYDRWVNLLDAFEIKCDKNIKGTKILLVDDVITTGATVFNCAMTLKKYGALEIIVLTAAKSCI